jgi:hypothetical protein
LVLSSVLLFLKGLMKSIEIGGAASHQRAETRAKI